MRPLLFIALTFFLATCISPYDLKIADHSPKLVVDGVITDQPGPHVVRLAYSAPYNNDPSYLTTAIKDATVYIEDNEGLRTMLTHKSLGSYETPQSFTSHVGKQYSLAIVLSNGKVYRSHPEEMKPVAKIDTIVGSYRELNGEFLRGEFDLRVETKDPPTPGDFYAYRWKHYEFKPWCWASPPNTQTRVVYRIRCCEGCWQTAECPECINIVSDKFVNGGSLSVPIVTIPYDSKDPYFIVIEQRSLSNAAYSFWHEVSTQITSSGGIFDKPPITITGNLYNVDDPEEQVLGFFGVSSVQVKSIHFKRDKIDKIPYSPDWIYQELVVQCITCETGSTQSTVTPPGW